MNAHRVLGILTTGITVAGGVIGALGIKAANMAMEFERFTATIGGGLGSLDKGKEVMSALEDYAQKSAFGLQDLAQATTQMVAAGLNIQQVLPMAERFALIISGTNPEGLMQVAGALARIKGGSFGEAMEIFRRAGVSATDLKAQGVSVTKGGEILGSPTQIMAAIERISQGRPKEMADAISKTSSVTISNSMDALDKGFREVGSSILNSALPAILKLTESFNDIVSGGGLNGISDAITSVIEKFTGDGGLTSIIGIVTTGLKNVAWWADKLTGKDSSDPLDIKPGSYYYNRWKPKGEMDMRGNDGWVESYVMPWTSESAIAENAKPFPKEILDRIKFGTKSRGGLPSTAQSEDPTATPSKAVGYLAQIAENTKLTKQDLRRLAFGAGAAEAGVTPVELSKMRHRRAGGTMGGEIGAIIEQYFHQQVLQMMKEYSR